MELHQWDLEILKFIKKHDSASRADIVKHFVNVGGNLICGGLRFDRLLARGFIEPTWHAVDIESHPIWHLAKQTKETGNYEVSRKGALAMSDAMPFSISKLESYWDSISKSPPVDIITNCDTPPAKPNPQMEATELYKVLGKVELQGFDEVSAQLDMLIEKAERLAGTLEKIAALNLSGSCQPATQENGLPKWKENLHNT